MHSNRHDHWDTVPVLHFAYLCGYFFRPTIHSLTYVHGFRRQMARLRGEFPSILCTHIRVFSMERQV